MPQEALLKQQLAPHGQEHLIRFWPDLRPDERAALERDLLAVDFGRLRSLVDSAGDQTNWQELARNALPPHAVRQRTEQQSGNAREIGAQLLSAGQVGVIITAGGEGTRLRMRPGEPKALFPIGPLSDASLLEIHFQRVLAARRKFDAAIPVYVMTSAATHEVIDRFLSTNQYFGLPAEDVFVFQQGKMPAVEEATGRILLKEKHQLAFSPDGHGGLLEAIHRSKAINDMERRGLRQLFYLQVDNPLTPTCDPELLGCHQAGNSEITTLAIAKRSSRDLLGNIISIDGRTRIIEYSELNPLADEIVERLDMNGQPVFWAGNTAIHVFETAFLRRMIETLDGLPFHVARKTVAHVNEDGIPVTPKSPNALKFERFVFDLLPNAESALVVEGDRAEIFAPVKNADDDERPEPPRDTPSTVRKQMSDLHKKWLQAAGVDVAEDAVVEISPTFAFDLEELRGHRDLPARINHDTYLR